MQKPSQTLTYFTLLKGILIGDALLFLLMGVLTWFSFGHTLAAFGYALLCAGSMIGLLGLAGLLGNGRRPISDPGRDLDRLRLYPRYANLQRIGTSNEPGGDDYKFFIATMSAGTLLALVGTLFCAYF